MEKKRISRRDAKPPREEEEGGLTTKCIKSTEGRGRWGSEKDEL